jgi:hypothetical protein
MQLLSIDALNAFLAMSGHNLIMVGFLFTSSRFFILVGWTDIWFFYQPLTHIKTN